MDTAHIKLAGAANAWLAVIAGLADGCVVVIRSDACLIARLIPTTSCVLSIAHLAPAFYRPGHNAVMQ